MAVCGASSGLNMRSSINSGRFLPQLSTLRRGSEPQIIDGDRRVLAVANRGLGGGPMRGGMRRTVLRQSQKSQPKMLASGAAGAEQVMAAAVSLDNSSAANAAKIAVASNVFTQPTNTAIKSSPPRQQHHEALQQQNQPPHMPQTSTPSSTPPLAAHYGLSEVDESVARMQTIAAAGVKPKKMTRAKTWNTEVENYFRFQAAGFRDGVDYLENNPPPAFWDTGFVRMLLNKKTGFYMYFRRTRELNDSVLHRIKMYSYDV